MPGLVDQWNLMVFPVILGSGRRLFPTDVEDKQKLQLTESKTYANGVQAAGLPSGLKNWSEWQTRAHPNAELTTTAPSPSRISKPAARSRSTEEFRLQSISLVPVPTNPPAGYRRPSTPSTVAR